MSKILNWVKKGAVTFSLATKRVEEDMLGQISDELNNINDAKVTPYYRNQLMQDLKEGRLTERVKQFRAKYYLVLRESEKYKTKWGAEGDFRMLTEEEIKNNRNAKGDPYDNYIVEVTVENRTLSEGLFEDNFSKTIKVQRGVFPKNRIEDYTELMLVRDIDGKNKLIEFYIPIHQGQNKQMLTEIQDLTNSPRVTDFVNITNVNFVTPGGNPLSFSYKMLAFDKVVQYNNNYVVKMFAEVIDNGRWVGEKYMLND
jgi:hypothetical protein